MLFEHLLWTVPLFHVFYANEITMIYTQPDDRKWGISQEEGPQQCLFGGLIDSMVLNKFIYNQLEQKLAAHAEEQERGGNPDGNDDGMGLRTLWFSYYIDNTTVMIP